MSSPADLIDVLGLLVDVLEHFDADYAIGGAIAQNYWGTVRATQDIDVLISLSRIRFQELADALATAGFRQRTESGEVVPVAVAAMVAEERERHLFTVYHDLVKVELFLPFLPLQRSILERAVDVTFDGRSVRITTAEDLVLLKMVFHRPKDLRDVRAMLWSQRSRIDKRYLSSWAERMLTDEAVRELDELVARYCADEG